MTDRDGFLILNSSGVEVHFISCTYDGNQRERVERGLLMKIRDDLIVTDTRDMRRQEERSSAPV